MLDPRRLIKATVRLRRNVNEALTGNFSSEEENSIRRNRKHSTSYGPPKSKRGSRNCWSSILLNLWRWSVSGKLPKTWETGLRSKSKVGSKNISSNCRRRECLFLVALTITTHTTILERYYFPPNERKKDFFFYPIQSISEWSQSKASSETQSTLFPHVDFLGYFNTFSLDERTG